MKTIVLNGKAMYRGSKEELNKWIDWYKETANRIEKQVEITMDDNFVYVNFV